MQLKILQKERMNERKREREEERRKEILASCFCFVAMTVNFTNVKSCSWTQPYIFLSSVSPDSKSSFLLCSLIPTSVCKLKPMCFLIVVVLATANLVFR